MSFKDVLKRFNKPTTIGNEVFTVKRGSNNDDDGNDGLVKNAHQIVPN